eukprot:3205419-Pleurochrysis_carterae.AAC.1
MLPTLPYTCSFWIEGIEETPRRRSYYHTIPYCTAERRGHGLQLASASIPFRKANVLPFLDVRRLNVALDASTSCLIQAHVATVRFLINCERCRQARAMPVAT